MSYRNPAVLQDTGAFKTKANALQGMQKEIDKPFKTKEKKEEEEDEKPGNSSKNSNKPVESQNQPFVKPTTTSQTVPGTGTEVPNIDQSQSAFYKSGGPINDPDFYKGFGASDDTDSSFWMGGQEDPKLKGV